MILDILKTVFFLFIGICGIGFLIGFHELGHFIFCKIFKIRTPSFSIGMGPQILKKKIGETEFSLSLIPAGGYVEIAGMAEVAQGEQKEAKRSDEYSFNSKPYYQKLLVMLGGILFNTVFAYFVMIALFMTGMPKLPLLYPYDPIVKSVEKDSAGQNFGLQPNDKITAINDHQVKTIEELNQALKNLANQQATITVERNSSKVPLINIIGSRNEDGKEIGFLNISFQYPNSFPEAEPESFLNSVKDGIKATNVIIVKIFQALKSLIKKPTTKGVGGPILIIAQTIESAKKGAKSFFILLAFISINLALLNLIPLPIMDGGQILFTTIEAIIRRPIPDQIRLIIHYICWISVVLLLLYLSFEDLKKIFIK